MDADVMAEHPDPEHLEPQSLADSTPGPIGSHQVLAAHFNQFATGPIADLCVDSDGCLLESQQFRSKEQPGMGVRRRSTQQDWFQLLLRAGGPFFWTHVEA